MFVSWSCNSHFTSTIIWQKKKTYQNNLIQRIVYITLFIYIIFPFSIFSHPFQNDSCCNQHENVPVSKKIMLLINLSKKRKQLNVFTQNCTVFKRLSLETGPPFYVVTWACMRRSQSHIFAGQRQYLLIILIKDPKFDLALGFEPATSLALQSTSLPTEPNGQVKLLPNGSLYLSETAHLPLP